MLIDVSRLAMGEQLEFEYDGSMTVRKVPAEVHTSGRVTFTKEGFVLSGSIKAVLDMECDLCLKSFRTELDLPLDEIFSNSGSGKDDEKKFWKEFWHYEEKTLDIQPAVEANILTAMPMKAVCSDSCRGLCPQCGHNLNEGECGCGREYSNPVFEQLMSLFDDEQ